MRINHVLPTNFPKNLHLRAFAKPNRVELETLSSIQLEMSRLKVQNFDQMRIFWIVTMLFLLGSGCESTPESDAESQESVPSVQEILKPMNDAERLAILYFAMEASDVNPERELRKIWTELSNDQQVDVVEFARNIDRMAPSFYLDQASTFRSSSRVQRIGESNKQKPARTRDSSEGPFAEIELDQQEFDFGRILDTETVRHAFSFRNTGDVPLIIDEVSGTCGCTAPTWTKTAIPPDGKGTVEVEYNPEGKSGRDRQSLTILANTQTTPVKIFVLADIVPADK